MSRYGVTARKDRLSHAEHCAANRTELDGIGRGLSHQVRIARSSTDVGLYTVERFSSDPGVVGMTAAGMRRLDGTEEFAVTVDAHAVNERITDEEAERRGDFVERMVVGGSRQLAVLAPHGGDIEVRTDEQAHIVGLGLSDVAPWIWICRGWHPGGGAFARWHITSTDLSPESFPLLERMIVEPFTHAVSFHGFDLNTYPGDDVRIGGRADGLKESARDEIEKQFRRAGSTLTVGVVQPGGDLSGSEPANIVNRLAPLNGGLQVEQSGRARREMAPEIAGAVVASYRSLFGLDD